MKKIKCITSMIIIITLLCISCKKEKNYEIEPNDTYMQANIITTNNPVFGYINTENDIDFYRLLIQSQGILDISVTAVKGVNIAFTVWEKTDEGIIALKYVDDMRKSAPERLRGLAVKPGEYFISLSHGDKDQRIKNTESTYMLSVKQENGDNFESEPNDSILMANILHIGVPVQGYYSPAFNKANTNVLNPNREEDWFTFSIDNAPVVCDIEVTGVPGIEAQLDLMDAQGTIIFSSRPSGQGVSQIAKGIGLSVVGNYYIALSAKNYAANNDVPYSLVVTTRTYDNTTEIEPNNVMASSNTIAGDTIYGRIYPDNDVDWYIYNGDSSDKKFYRIEVMPPITIDSLFSLYNEKGEELYSVNNGGVGEKEVHPNCEISAPFYIKIWAKRGQFDIDNNYMVAIAPVHIDNLQDIEPNDSKEQASVVQGNIIVGYISKAGDVDYYVLQYKGRQKKYFVVKADELPLSLSVTDSLGYILQTIKVKQGRTATLSEIIDGKGFLIVKPLKDVYDKLYTIEIKDKP